MHLHRVDHALVPPRQSKESKSLCKGTSKAVGAMSAIGRHGAGWNGDLTKQLAQLALGVAWGSAIKASTLGRVDPTTGGLKEYRTKTPDFRSAKKFFESVVYCIPIRKIRYPRSFPG